jgi:hypothetical protein
LLFARNVFLDNAVLYTGPGNKFDVIKAHYQDAQYKDGKWMLPSMLGN